jgi:hypothetical protein
VPEDVQLIKNTRFNNDFLLVIWLPFYGRQSHRKQIKTIKYFYGLLSISLCASKHYFRDFRKKSNGAQEAFLPSVKAAAIYQIKPPFLLIFAITRYNIGIYETLVFLGNRRFARYKCTGTG